MFRVILLILAVIARISSKNNTEEDHVLVLNISNFDKTIEENTFVLVEFYAPSCEHCKALAPEYSLAAKLLKEQGRSVKLAKVDATVELQLAELYNINSYPTLIFFNNGTRTILEGGQTADSLVNWLDRKMGIPAKDLKDKISVEAFKNKSEVSIIGFFKDQNSESAQEFLKVANAVEFEETPFGITSNSDVFDDHKVTNDRVVLFKKFDEGRNDFEGEFNEKAIATFISDNQLPHVIEFSQSVIKKIFTSRVKKHLLLFIKKEGNEDIFKGFHEVSKEFKGQFLFIHMDTENTNHGPILQFFDLSESHIPAIRIAHFDDEVSKYKPTSTGVDPDAIRKFIKEYGDENLKPYFYSEAIPEDWDSKPVKVLVGHNLKEVTLNKEKGVLVKYYYPSCQRCEQLALILDQLGEHYKDNDKIVIAKFNVANNEQEKIANIPAFKYFPHGNDEVIDYTGDTTLEAFKIFLDSNGKNVVSIKEEEKKDQVDAGEDKEEKVDKKEKVVEEEQEANDKKVDEKKKADKKEEL